jgi:hypothetical protein
VRATPQPCLGSNPFAHDRIHRIFLPPGGCACLPAQMIDCPQRPPFPFSFPGWALHGCRPCPAAQSRNACPVCFPLLRTICSIATTAVSLPPRSLFPATHCFACATFDRRGPAVLLWPRYFTNSTHESPPCCTHLPRCIGLPDLPTGNHFLGPSTPLIGAPPPGASAKWMLLGCSLTSILPWKPPGYTTCVTTLVAGHTQGRQERCWSVCGVRVREGVQNEEGCEQCGIYHECQERRREREGKGCKAAGEGKGARRACARENQPAGFAPAEHKYT